MRDIIDNFKKSPPLFKIIYTPLFAGWFILMYSMLRSLFDMLSSQSSETRGFSALFLMIMLIPFLAVGTSAFLLLTFKREGKFLTIVLAALALVGYGFLISINGFTLTNPKNSRGVMTGAQY